MDQHLAGKTGAHASKYHGGNRTNHADQYADHGKHKIRPKKSRGLQNVLEPVFSLYRHQLKKASFAIW